MDAGMRCMMDGWMNEWQIDCNQQSFTYYIEYMYVPQVFTYYRFYCTCYQENQRFTLCHRIMGYL